LVGLINAEISSKWDIEAVKAQAVIARTYALYQKNNSPESYYDLESTVLDQVYKGTGKEDSSSRYAVETTRGEVLVYNGNIIKSFYHSNCGGRTEEPIFVWNEDLPYLKSVKDNYCKTSAPNTFWDYQISKIALEEKLSIFGYNIKNIKKIDIIKRSPSGRILELEIRGSNIYDDISYAYIERQNKADRGATKPRSEAYLRYAATTRRGSNKGMRGYDSLYKII
jgi:stage II sporulation protein D